MTLCAASGLTLCAKPGAMMANTKFNLDTSGLDALFKAIGSEPAKESLARTMLVNAGSEMRDQAKVNTQVYQYRGPYNPNGSSASSQAAGTLRDSIYLAYDKDESGGNFYRYNVSWNNDKAWWGRLLEFGYFQKYKVYIADGLWWTNKKAPLDEPVWVPAKPFLAPAFDATKPQLLRLMGDAGRNWFADRVPQ